MNVESRESPRTRLAESSACGPRGPRTPPASNAQPTAATSLPCLARFAWAAAALVLLAAVVGSSCVAGLRTEPYRAVDGFCPPRWAAAGDPLLAAASESMALVAADAPDGARPLLPDRPARLSAGCTLRLPLHIRAGRCYLFAAQIFPSSGRAEAEVAIPDPRQDGLLRHRLDHSMAATLGEGADPVCYDDELDARAEVTTAGHADLVWVQAFEVAPEAAEHWAAERRQALAAIQRTAPAASPRPRDAGLATSADLTLVIDAGPEADASRPEADADPAASTAEVETRDAGPSEAGAAAAADAGRPAEDAGDAVPVDGDQPTDADLSELDTAPRIAPTEPPPAPPAGPLAFEASCSNRADDDADGRADCADPDCVEGCSSHRLDRLPWGAVLDVRVGMAARTSYESTEDGIEGARAEEPLDPAYDALVLEWGLSSQVGAVYRPSSYLGVGLDLGFGHSVSSSYPPPPEPRHSQNRVRANAFSLGIGLHVSVPVWILEVGGSVGVGWLMIATTGEERSLSGDLSWRRNPDVDASSHHAYAEGLLWLDAWVLDALAVGLYGGVLAPLGEVPGLPATDYHVGLRATLRLVLR